MSPEDGEKARASDGRGHKRGSIKGSATCLPHQGIIVFAIGAAAVTAPEAGGDRAAQPAGRLHGLLGDTLGLGKHGLFEGSRSGGNKSMKRLPVRPRGIGLLERDRRMTRQPGGCETGCYSKAGSPSQAFCVTSDMRQPEEGQTRREQMSARSLSVSETEERGLDETMPMGKRHGRELGTQRRLLFLRAIQICRKMG